MANPKEFPNEAENAFTFRLAKDLKMTVSDLRRKLSVEEFQTWIAYYEAVAIEEKRQSKLAEQKAKAKRGRR